MLFAPILVLAVQWTWCDGALAAVSDAQIQQAIERGIAFLKASQTTVDGRASLMAYALLKSDEPPDTPFITATVQRIQAKFRSETYIQPANHIYEAAVDLMVLEAADPKNYRDEIQAIADYIISSQRGGGEWDYPDQNNGGDTSISQYAILGLWAAARAEIDVPMSVWDRAARWHLKFQSSNGGFDYHPAWSNQSPRHSMTAAGSGSLHIIRMHLYPNAKSRRRTSTTSKAGRKFGVLERVKPDGERKSPSKTKGTPSTSLAGINDSISDGIGWLSENFTVDKPTGWPLYYLYAMERLCALGNLKQIGGHDWYQEGAEHLVRIQEKDGSWLGTRGTLGNKYTATSFALLFLTRATAKTINHPVHSIVGIGTGLLAGGRGLPDNLLQVQSKDGRIKAKKTVGPIDQLLSELENPKSLNVGAAQQAIVEKVQIGDREALIGQKKRLVKLVKHPNAEIRRTSLWALGRCDDLRLAPLLIKALQDADVDVMVEARNALCTLARKPRGIEAAKDTPKYLPDFPLAGLPEDASEAERQREIKRWRTKAIERWSKWYLSVRPYDERDDLPASKR